MPYYKLLWPQGLVGAWASALTREALFDALWKRRVFGTTGTRITLRFTLDGYPMGSEVQTTQSRRLTVEAAVPRPVQEVVIVRNGADWRAFRPDTQQCRIETRDPGHGPAWYYVRLTCEDGNMAWSSPIWVTA